MEIIWLYHDGSIIRYLSSYYFEVGISIGKYSPPPSINSLEYIHGSTSKNGGFSGWKKRSDPSHHHWILGIFDFRITGWASRALESSRFPLPFVVSRLRVADRCRWRWWSGRRETEKLFPGNTGGVFFLQKRKKGESVQWQMDYSVFFHVFFM